jgi:hypothetical protein
MGLFDFFKRTPVVITEEAAIQELKSYSWQSILLATPAIEQSGTFLTFGAFVTSKNKRLQVIYTDTNGKPPDHEEQTNIVQKSQDPTCRLWFIVNEDIIGLDTGIIDSIKVRCGNNGMNVVKIIIYPYRIIDGKIEFVDKENPIMYNG